MKKKIVTLLLLLVSSALAVCNWRLTLGYYGADYYQASLSSGTEELIFEGGAGDSGDAAKQLSVRVRNDSRKAISSENGIFVSSHLLDAEGNVLVYDMPRFDIPTLDPFNETGVTVTVAKPDAAGVYGLEIDLVEENVCWFRDKGNQTLYVRLTVYA